MSELYFFENVMTISKQELENMASWPPYGSNWFNDPLDYQPQLSFDGGNFDYNLSIRPDPDNVRDESTRKYGGNILIYVESANYFVKSESTVSQYVDNSFVDWRIHFSTRTDILNPEKKFFVDGKLTVHMKAIIYEVKHSDAYDKPFHPTLTNFLWKRDDRDFIISVGKNNGPKKEIKIHKLILVSRSPVFDRMLNMQENVENRLEITDYDFEVIEAAVEYFYDQEGLEFYDLDILVDCLHFAVEYDIGDFKNKLEHYLFFRVYPDTFCQIANASISYNLMKLKEFCLNVFDLYVEHSMAVDDFEMLDPAFVEEMHTE